MPVVSLNVRFAPKATVGRQNPIRRFVHKMGKREPASDIDTGVMDSTESA